MLETPADNHKRAVRAVQIIEATLREAERLRVPAGTHLHRGFELNAVEDALAILARPA